MKTFLKKVVNWLGLNSRSGIINACMSLLAAALLALFFFVDPNTQFGDFVFNNVLIIMSIYCGLGILHSIYCLVWDKRYAKKKNYPISYMVSMVIFLILIWTYLKPGFDRTEEIERKWRMENVCTKDD